MADDVLTNLTWLTTGGQPGLLQPPTPPSTPPPPASPPVNYRDEAVKPPYSYAQLIAMAMEAHGGAKVVLTDIYAWIRDNFAYFRGSDNSWQVSLLSLPEFFEVTLEESTLPELHPAQPLPQQAVRQGPPGSQ